MNTWWNCSRGAAQTHHLYPRPRHGMACHATVWHAMAWPGIPHAMACLGMACHGMPWHATVWHSMPDHCTCNIRIYNLHHVAATHLFCISFWSSTNELPPERSNIHVRTWRETQASIHAQIDLAKADKHPRPKRVEMLQLKLEQHRHKRQSTKILLFDIEAKWPVYTLKSVSESARRDRIIAMMLNMEHAHLRIGRPIRYLPRRG